MRANRAPLAAMRAARPAREILFDHSVPVAKRREAERRHRRPENRYDLAACGDAEMCRRAVVADENLAAIKQGSGLAERELAGGVAASLANFARKAGTKLGIALASN